MKQIREKSPCCRGSVWRFGERRRRCSVCQKTWRVWKKNRGRKKNRLNFNSLFQYFERKSKNTRLNKKILSARLRLILEKFNAETPWPKIPKGPLIVVADGLIEYFGNKKYSVYFIIIRSISNSRAYIFPPYMREEGEVVLGWKEAFGRLPNEVLSRICALVCDGHGGLVYLAKTHGWALQRCHFHLIYNIAHFSSFGHLNQTHNMGLRIKNLVQIILHHKDTEAISLALVALQKIKNGITSRSFKTVISGFLKHYEDYRTYLNYPQYFLPTTSNSAEFLNSQIRDIQYRARGFRTPKSFFSWIIGFCKYKKFVTCRSKIQPN